jgi:hypothetical protein
MPSRVSECSAAGESALAGIFRKGLCDEIHHTCGLTPAILGDLLK